jgi:hypothetical protein
MPETSHYKAITVRLPEAHYAFLRVIAAEDTVSMGGYIANILGVEIDRLRAVSRESSVADVLARRVLESSQTSTEQHRTTC